MSRGWWHGLPAGSLLALSMAGPRAVPAAAATSPDPGVVSGDVSVHDPSMVLSINLLGWSCSGWPFVM